MRLFFAITSYKQFQEALRLKYYRRDVSDYAKSIKKKVSINASVSAAPPSRSRLMWKYLIKLLHNVTWLNIIPNNSDLFTIFYLFLFLYYIVIATFLLFSLCACLFIFSNDLSNNQFVHLFIF